MSKKIFISTILFLMFSSFLRTAENIFNEFKTQFQQTYVDPFNKDLTGVVCSNVFNRGENLGWFSVLPRPSIGVNIKISVAGKKPDKNNVIVNNFLANQSVKLIPFVTLQIEKGLPFNIDLIGRYFGFENFTFYGVGIKYKIFSFPPIMPVVNISIAGLYNKLDAKDILQHISYSVNAVVSVDKIPVIKPYISVGTDTGELNVDNKVFPGGMKSKFSSGRRIEAGINFSFIPFVYLNLNYAQIYNTEGYGANLGVKF
ncbi:MAG: hypothetical protein NZ839_00350 [Endomicrobia bacterium]|nr:hypothetical protein [Endomicrobiia bacterium]